MTGGEGGCLTTNDEHLADLAFRLSHIGNSQLHPKDPLQIGLECHQYRFTEFQAAIIYDQLHHQTENRAKRQAGVKIICDILKDVPVIQLQKSSYEDDLRDYYFLSFLLQKEYLKEGIDRAWIFKALWEEGTPLGSGWGSPLYKSPAWNIPADQFIKRDTEVCEDVMYHRLLATLHGILLAEPAVLTRWAESVRKVMLACMNCMK